MIHSPPFPCYQASAAQAGSGVPAADMLDAWQELVDAVTSEKGWAPMHRVSGRCSPAGRAAVL
jgi:hypothetical protein